MIGDIDIELYARKLFVVYSTARMHVDLGDSPYFDAMTGAERAGWIAAATTALADRGAADASVCITRKMADDVRTVAEKIARCEQLQAAHVLGLDLVTKPVPMILTCPACNARHVDVGEFATKVHHTHACQGCGMVWRPALVATVGVQFLPGFRNA